MISILFFFTSVFQQIHSMAFLGVQSIVKEMSLFFFYFGCAKSGNNIKQVKTELFLPVCLENILIGPILSQQLRYDKWFHILSLGLFSNLFLWLVKDIQTRLSDEKLLRCYCNDLSDGLIGCLFCFGSFLGLFCIEMNKRITSFASGLYTWIWQP